MKELLSVIAMLSCALVFSCQRPPAPTDDPTVWQKIKIDFSKIDENGLRGPENGKVLVHYEFCIPAEEATLRAVQKIDTTAQVMKGSAGRSGCKPGETWLVIGNTRQKNYKRVLYDLARLPYVTRIQETFFE